MSPPRRIAVGEPVDVEIARRAARSVALSAGFKVNQIDDIVIAISELATNLLHHAIDGVLTLTVVACDGRSGLRIESRDAGPGIDDLELALRDGFSTTGSLGSGLPIARRLVDEMHIESSRSGTVIVAYKWT